MEKSLGRPVDKTLDLRLYDATLTLLENSGYRQLSMEKIANLASTSRQTIYRKYGSLDHLIATSVQHYYRDAEAAESTGDLYEDILNHLHGTAKILTETRVGRVFKFIIPEFGKNQEFGKIGNQIGVVRRQHLTELFKRAINESVIAQETQIEAVIDGLIGAIFFRFLLTDRSLDKRYLRTLLMGLVSKSV